MKQIEPISDDGIEQIELIIELKYSDIAAAHIQQYIELLYNKYKELTNGA